MSFLKRYPTELNGLVTARDDALKELANMDVTDASYAPTLEHVKTLSELIVAESRDPLSVNTLVTVAANVTGILMIVGYEKANVLTSKAISLVGKAK